jgi:hypothetical protein
VAVRPRDSRCYEKVSFRSIGDLWRDIYLVNGVDDPVDAGILADSLVLGVDENDFEVLVG